MKKIFFVSIFLLLTILFPNPAQGEGQNCCDPGLHYNVSSGDCLNAAVMGHITSQPSNCSSQEYCSSEGICVTSGSPVDGCREEEGGAFDFECNLSTGEILYCRNANRCQAAQEAINATLSEDTATSTSLFNLCNSIPDENKRNACIGCLGEGENSDTSKMWTAIGCLPLTPTAFVQTILPTAVTIAGAIALLTMLYGVLMLTISGGNPENIQKAKEVITGAVVGLLFIIFSIVLLNLIGVQILKIPGF
jgi:hypothetical protein